MTTAEHLRLIEKEMVRLRDLYRGGHITRDMAMLMKPEHYIIRHGAYHLFPNVLIKKTY